MSLGLSDSRVAVAASIHAVTFIMSSQVFDGWDLNSSNGCSKFFSFISSSVQSTSASAGQFLNSAPAQKKTSVLVAGYCDMFTEDPHTLQIGTGNARQYCERVLSSHVDSVTVFGALFGLWRNLSPSSAFSTYCGTELLRNSTMVLV